MDGKVAGSQKKVGRLDFRIVNNAGHLVPMDQGLVALEMVKDFVNSNKKKWMRLINKIKYLFIYLFIVLEIDSLSANIQQSIRY